MVVTNVQDPWVRDISWASLFPEASFSQLSISPWCLKRGTTAISLQPRSALRSLCRPQTAMSDYHSAGDETHTHKLLGKGKQSHLCLSGYFLYCSMHVCDRALPASSSLIIFVHLPAKPMERSKKGFCAIYLNFPNLLTFFVWPVSPWAWSLKTVVVQQLW